MAYCRRFFYKLRNFLRPDIAEFDLTREISTHLELLQNKFRQQGMTAEQARLAAKRGYGGIEQTKELHREARSWLWLEQVRQDIHFSIRTLLNSPGFSLTVILMLALGIGANTAIFSLMDALMLRSLPVSHPEQLVQVNMAKRDIWGMEGPFVSNPVWEQLRARHDVFPDCSAMLLRGLTYRAEARLATCKGTMYPVSFSRRWACAPSWDEP